MECSRVCTCKTEYKIEINEKAFDIDSTVTARWVIMCHQNRLFVTLHRPTAQRICSLSEVTANRLFWQRPMAGATKQRIHFISFLFFVFVDFLMNDKCGSCLGCILHREHNPWRFGTHNIHIYIYIVFPKLNFFLIKNCFSSSISRFFLSFFVSIFSYPATPTRSARSERNCLECQCIGYQRTDHQSSIIHHIPNWCGRRSKSASWCIVSGYIPQTSSYHICRWQFSAYAA